MDNMNIPQPMPSQSAHKACWDQAIEDFDSCVDSGPIKEEVIRIFRERDRIGEMKYKTRLRPFDGRDTRIDLVQELMDAYVYATKIAMENEQETVFIQYIISKIRELINCTYYHTTVGQWAQSDPLSGKVGS